MKKKTARTLPLALILLISCGSAPQDPSTLNPARNRLKGEQSPYLLQHADNPVNWWPWCDEAFEEARRRDLPVFLSVGYSTCHWCHVMERESFEDQSVARILNDRYICIKVDREERPDIDNVYMAAVQLMTGRGGWPMSVWLTPDRKPFFGGTYFPPEARWNQPGFKDVLVRLSDTWKNRRADVIKASTDLTVRLDDLSAVTRGKLDADAAFAKATRMYRESHDEDHGGFGPPPKFPRPHDLRLLMRLADRVGEKDLPEIVDRTLVHMADGGLQDHVGGGFHRYSTDRQWLVPHFEKMLYDQAQLALAYTEAYQRSGRQRHGRTARRILDYVLRDMTHPDGGFFSAEDADTEGHEGRFYVWKPDEIVSALGKKDGALFSELYDVTDKGNFEGRSIPHPVTTVEKAADRAGLSVTDYLAKRDSLMETLRTVRSRRTAPSRDDKVLTAWNGLMIAAFARAARTFDEPRYRRAAERCATFVLDNLRHKGRILRRWRNGHAAQLGFVDDHVFLCHGLIELYMATGRTDWLKEAHNLARQTVTHFWDDGDGALHFSARDGEQMIRGIKSATDGALPSGNSVAALDFQRLGRMTGDDELEKKGLAILEAYADRIASSPMAVPQMLIALDFARGPVREIVISGDPSADTFKDMRRTVDALWLPRDLLILADRKDRELERVAPWIRRQPSREAEATGYVCENRACHSPVSELSGFRSILLRKE